MALLTSVLRIVGLVGSGLIFATTFHSPAHAQGDVLITADTVYHNDYTQSWGGGRPTNTAEWLSNTYMMTGQASSGVSFNGQLANGPSGTSSNSQRFLLTNGTDARSTISIGALGGGVAYPNGNSWYYAYGEFKVVGVGYYIL